MRALLSISKGKEEMKLQQADEYNLGNKPQHPGECDRKESCRND